MREITDHVVDLETDHLDIMVLDDVGHGGVHHHYVVESKVTGRMLDVMFQNGPIQETSINGITQEVLLAIVIDRLRCFQNGPYACNENAAAIRHASEALDWLKARTRNRIRRGVEGKSLP